MKVGTNTLLIAAGVGLLAVGLFVWKKGGVSGAAQAVGGAAVDAVGGVASGVVYGIGDTLQIPRTSETECSRALREGRTWDASFACPAADFLRGTFSRRDNAGTSQAATGDTIRTPPIAPRDEIPGLFMDPFGYGWQP